MIGVGARVGLWVEPTTTQRVAERSGYVREACVGRAVGADPAGIGPVSAGTRSGPGTSA